MTEYIAKRNPNRCPSHPGVLIADLLQELKVPVSQGARAIGISRQHLYSLIAQKKPVTAAVAIRLGKAFNDGPDVWLRMQGAYDTWHAAREVDLSTTQVLKAA